MSTPVFVILQLTLAAANLPGMRRGYWWSYVSTGIILGMLWVGLVYKYV